jgi:hypothetical protein
MSFIAGPLGLPNPTGHPGEIQTHTAHWTPIQGPGTPQAPQVQAIFDQVSHVDQYFTRFPPLRDSHPERGDILYLNLN